MKHIPFKNYVIFLIITILSIGASIYCINLYDLRSNYEKGVNYNMSFLKEIHINDLENYIIENPDIIIYINEKNDSEMNDIELKLKKHIIQREYTNDIVYINSNSSNKKLLKKINGYSKEKFNVIPNVIIIKNSEISETLYFDGNVDEFKIIEFMGLYYND